MDQINNFELIRLVKETPLLWNKSLPGYKNMRAKYRIWAGIADSLGIDHSGHEPKGIQYKGYCNWLIKMTVHTN